MNQALNNPTLLMIIMPLLMCALSGVIGTAPPLTCSAYAVQQCCPVLLLDVTLACTAGLAEVNVDVSFMWLCHITSA
jgi:hypothetical protein